MKISIEKFNKVKQKILKETRLKAEQQQSAVGETSNIY